MERQAAQGVAERPDPYELPDCSNVTVGIIGGTGQQGRGLAGRWGAAGLKVVIGSRDGARAAQAAAQLPAGVIGVSNDECASMCDVAVVAVPWSAHEATLVELGSALRGRVVVDCVNPLGFDKSGAFALTVPEGSAAQQAAALLPESRVTAAFHHVSSVRLLDPQVTSIDADVMVLGDDRGATDLVQALAGVIPGMRGIYAGRLRNAGQVEALTANLISVNRRYRVHSSVRLTLE